MLRPSHLLILIVTIKAKAEFWKNTNKIINQDTTFNKTLSVI